MVVGLTGGIGSGKSTVSRMFEQLGVPVVDADVVAREIVEPGQPALAAVVSAFGPVVLDAHGRLDRARLREQVFREPERRRELEALLHPRIRTEMQKRVAALDAPYYIESVPLLIESGRAGEVDRLLLVDLPEDLQVARTLARDGGLEETIRAIMASQASREQRLAVAHDVIDNSEPVQAVHRRVEDLHRRYLEAAAGRHLPAASHQ